MSRLGAVGLAVLCAACGETSLSGQSSAAKPAASSTTGAKRSTTTAAPAGASPTTTVPQLVEDETCEHAVISTPPDGKKDKILVTLKLLPDNGSYLALVAAGDDAGIDTSTEIDTKNPLAAVALALSGKAYADLKKDPKSHDVRYLPTKDAKPSAASWACQVPKKVVDELEEPEAAPAPTDAPATTTSTTLPPKIEGCIVAPTTCTAFCAGKGKTCEKAVSGWGVVNAGIVCGDGNLTPLPCDESGAGHPFAGSAPPNSIGCICNP